MNDTYVIGAVVHDKSLRSEPTLHFLCNSNTHGYYLDTHYLNKDLLIMTRAFAHTEMKALSKTGKDTSNPYQLKLYQVFLNEVPFDDSVE